MDTTPYILNEYQPFSLKSHIGTIKVFFSDTPFSHFPVVQDERLIGLVSRSDFESLEDDNQEIGQFHELLGFFHTEQSNNLLDIIKIFAANEANVVPVVGKEAQFLGYFDLIDILHVLNDTPYLNHEGDSILIQKETPDYSFSEICQIVESNKGKVLGVFVLERNDITVKVCLKFDAPEVNEIIQTFRRYNYTVLSNHKEDFYLEDLKYRSDYLQKYLNI